MKKRRYFEIKAGQIKAKHKGRMKSEVVFTASLFLCFLVICRGRISATNSRFQHSEKLSYSVIMVSGLKKP